MGTQIKFINSYRHISNGKGVFGSITVDLHDPIAPSGAQQVMEWVRTHYESVSGRAGPGGPGGRLPSSRLERHPRPQTRKSVCAKEA